MENELQSISKKCIGRGKKKNRRGCKIMRNHKNNSVVRVGIIMGEKEILPIIYLEEFFISINKNLLD